ncbi:hypothetical protein SAMN05421847_0010 [Halpernia humi]|uniref:Uncharacterized protein n=1 Tax=Halpernia humi TaxID=493375 RepID=A0A1H5S2X0_9FLAO|nr:hypothetical protein [Halpernia humi]SEF44111.1 hypothetical protein SAMN05421847_0010 [Halpernia humi]
MKLFRKNIGWIIGLILISFNTFYLQPEVEKSYLNFDIENFTKMYYLKIIIIATLILVMSIIVYSLIKKKSFEIISGYFLGLILFCFIFFFVMQSFLTSVILFLNKLESQNPHKEVYKILYIKDNYNFTAYNIKRDNDFIRDENYLNQKQKENLKNLKVGDTLVFQMHEGFFGVDYIDKN